MPNTRKDLYALLKDVEESGGWHYIERGKLQSFIRNLVKAENETIVTEQTTQKEREN